MSCHNVRAVIMKYKPSSLDALQNFVSESHVIRSLLLIRHEACLNWSQLYTTTGERSKAIHGAYASYHRHIDEYWFDRVSFLDVTLRDLELRCNSREVFSVASLVRTDEKGYYHLPVMNLHPRRGVTLNGLVEYIKYVSANRKGVLLRTDRYFHYMGFYLLTHDEWLKFLGKMLIPFIFVNPGYIGYSLLRGYCCIRLTAAEEIKRITPYVIKEI